MPPTNATYDDDTQTISVAASADSPFASETQYLTPLTWDWQLSCDGGNTWISAGSSANYIYVSLVSPGSAGISPYRSVVHLACFISGATTADQAVLNTWAMLQGPSNFNGWNAAANSWTRPLYYYEPGTMFTGNAVGSAGAILNSSSGTGQCSTWACLMGDAICLNGGRSNLQYTTAIGLPATVVWAFLVNNWTFNAPTPYTCNLPGPGSEMLPTPPGNLYGQCQNGTGLAGQNSGTPSEKAFGNHQFLLYLASGVDPVYYDPSYGVTYASNVDFQTKAAAALLEPIAGWLYAVSPIPAGRFQLTSAAY